MCDFSGRLRYRLDVIESGKYDRAGDSFMEEVIRQDRCETLRTLRNLAIREQTWSFPFYRWLHLAILASCVCAIGCRSRPHSDPVVINWNTMHQVIDGFGASATGYVAGLT